MSFPIKKPEVTSTVIVEEYKVVWPDLANPYTCKSIVDHCLSCCKLTQCSWLWKLAQEWRWRKLLSQFIHMQLKVIHFHCVNCNYNQQKINYGNLYNILWTTNRTNAEDVIFTEFIGFRTLIQYFKSYFFNFMPVWCHLSIKMLL